MLLERSKWNDKSRDGLEYILMKEGYEDSKLSVNAYGKGTEHPRDFIEDIKSNIKNHDLVDLYTSLGKKNWYDPLKHLKLTCNRWMIYSMLCSKWRLIFGSSTPRSLRWSRQLDYVDNYSNNTSRRSDEIDRRSFQKSI